jgi:TonB family protein
MFGSLVFSLFLSWVQVSSNTYIVKSSAGEERAKRVLNELERFHQLIGATLVFRNTALPELPIEVLLVGDEQMMKELEPEYKGRKVPVAGYYQAGQDRDFIVLSGRVFPDTLTSVVYHELTHYFLARGLVGRPAWLNEGLAEYFSTAEIRDDEVVLGGLSQDRLQLLKTSSILPLNDFFAVDSSSAYYNENSKVGVFYAQAWAFTHYLMHGEHAAAFKQYLTALQKGDADLLRYVNVSERELDSGFKNYLKQILVRSSRDVVKVTVGAWDTSIESIPDTDAQMSIAEIFLANGKFAEARRHLEILAAQAPDSTRVSYYRGILARMSGDPAARDFFVDALLDPFLAPRAAVQLAQMGELQIPSVRTTLEDAAAKRTRTPEVYLTLANIYSEEVRRIEEAVRLSRQSAEAPVLRSLPKQEIEAIWHSYLRGADHHIAYSLLSNSDKHPALSRLTAPYYPDDLLAENRGGEVVLDVQVTAEGRVAGVWLISATPEVFESLATASVREWEFEPQAAKIRIILQFKP